MQDAIDTLSAESIRAAVAEQYGRVVSYPGETLPFPIGRAFAESLGYSPDLLDTLPKQAVRAFAGISCPLRYADLQRGERVLDLGCGAGMDTLIAARQVGPKGCVHSLDLSSDMLECARTSAAIAGLHNIIFHLGPAEAISLSDGAIDVVIVNGIFNLCPAKEPVMAEVYRVLRPGGRLVVSEIVIRDTAEPGEQGTLLSREDSKPLGRTLETWFQ